MQRPSTTPGLINVRQELYITRHQLVSSPLSLKKSQMMKQILSRSSLLHDPCKSGGWQFWHARRIFSQPIETSEIEAIHKTATHKKRWQPHETQILIAAKKEVECVIAENGSRRKRKRWEDIEMLCQTKGVERTAQQCKERWDRLMVLYSQIRSWENARNSERLSFWSMDVSERKSNGFLMGLDRESYVALDELCNKEGMLDVTENPIETGRKVEDGDGIHSFQAERNDLVEARVSSVHDEGDLNANAGFTPSTDANVDYVQATIERSNVENQKTERDVDVKDICSNPTEGLPDATAYVGIDKVGADNESTRMTSTQMEDHIKVVHLQTTEQHIKAAEFVNPHNIIDPPRNVQSTAAESASADGTIILPRNKQSAEEEVNFILPSLISHNPQGESSSGENLFLVDQQSEASKGINSAEFPCMHDNGTRKHLSNGISLQGDVHHHQDGLVSDRQSGICSHDAELPSKEANTAKEGDGFKQNDKHIEGKEVSVSDNQMLMQEETSYASISGKIENEMEKGVVSNKAKVKGVDLPFCCEVTENERGNQIVNRTEEVSYKLKVPDKLSRERSSSMQIVSDANAKSSKAIETSKQGSEESKHMKATTKGATPNKNGEWDDDVILFMQTAFANLAKFVSHAIRRLFKG